MAPLSDNIGTTEGAGDTEDGSEVVPPIRIVMGAKRGLAGRPPGRPKKKRRKMTPRKIVVGGGGGKKSGGVSGVFEAEMPDSENLTDDGSGTGGKPQRVRGAP